MTDSPEIGAGFPEPTFGADFWTVCHRHMSSGLYFRIVTVVGSALVEFSETFRAHALRWRYRGTGTCCLCR